MPTIIRTSHHGGGLVRAAEAAPSAHLVEAGTHGLAALVHTLLRLHVQHIW